MARNFSSYQRRGFEKVLCTVIHPAHPSLPLGTHYAVVWDWLWDATAGCYKGPGLNQCNTGAWRVQSFSLTSSATPIPTPSPTPTPIPSPVAFVQNCANFNASGITVSCAFPTSNTAANTLVVMIDWSDTVGRAVSSLTDTHGNTYTSAAATCSNTCANRG